MFKQYMISFLISTLSILGSLLVVTLFYYFDIISDQFYNFLKFIILFISVFIGSFLVGRKTIKKGYLEGLKFGIILISLLFIITIIFNKIHFKLIIYYTIILLSSILGGMIGISKKKELN